MYKRFFQVIFLCVFPFITNGETYYFNAPQSGYATELKFAIENAEINDVFVLTSSWGKYVFENTVVVSKPILIKAEEGIRNPLLKVDNKESIFKIQGTGALELISLELSTSEYTDVNCINITSTIPEFAYNLTIRNTNFVTDNSVAILAGSGTVAENIFLENCFFHNSECLSFDSGLAGNEASFSIIELESCVFVNCPKGAFYLPSVANVEYGNVLINHCVFDSIAQNDSLHILSIHGVAGIEIKNSVFSNSTNPDPFNLSNNALLDYCNFYRCNDIGTGTGAHCLYYKPEYDSLYFVGNENLFAKADDGKNIGILPWVYSGENNDTIDIGDNPHGFENQGVWVMPKTDNNDRWESYFLNYDTKNKLRYRKQINGDKIPDFSFVGYKMGNKELPAANIVATIYPTNDDATAYFQRVIDSVAENVDLNEDGIRGSILVKAGIYHLSSAIYIKANGIILTGEGASEEKTVLIAESVTNGSKLINIGATSGLLVKIESTGKDIAVPYIPVGAKYVLVNKEHSFEQGDAVCIYQQFNDALISDLKMNQIPDDGDVVQWNSADYNFTFEREVERVSSGVAYDSIFFYNPIVMALDSKYNSVRKIYKYAFTRVNNCGVENMLLKSVYASETDEDHAWDAVYFNRAEHCWAKNITSKHFAYSCANVSSYARYITVTHCTSLSPKSIETGGRRYSFNCDGQTSLFTYCHASEGRHDYVNGARVCGPNVFSFCSATKATNDIGPHHRWSVGTLYDNISTNGEINVRDRGSMGTGHGWAGANQVFWNCSGASSICQNPWVYAKNYNIGFKGTFENYTSFGNRPRGEWDGNNVQGLNPSSLYFGQRLDNNLSIDFGLGSRDAKFINDSTFRVYFNQTIDESSALNGQNYIASGSGGIVGEPYLVKMIDLQTVDLYYKGFGILTFNKYVDFQITNVKSDNGSNLTGISKCSLKIPDLRPVVDISYQEVTNAHDAYAEISSDKQGWVYLIVSHQKPLSANHINELVDLGYGNKSTVLKDSVAKISTYSLSQNTYYAYAVDLDGRLSNKGQYGVEVSNVLGVDDDLHDSAHIFLYKNVLHVNILDEDLNNATIQIYDALGRIFYMNSIQEGRTTIPLINKDNLLIVCLSSKNKIFRKKLININ